MQYNIRKSIKAVKNVLNEAIDNQEVIWQSEESIGNSNISIEGSWDLDEDEKERIDQLLFDNNLMDVPLDYNSSKTLSEMADKHIETANRIREIDKFLKENNVYKVDIDYNR